MHDCPDCGQACDCDRDDLWTDSPLDCSCCCGLNDCESCGLAGSLCKCRGDEDGCDEAPPYVCPGCHAVGGERCADGCPDAAIEARDAADLEADDGAADDPLDDDCDDEPCAACGGHVSHFIDCPVADD